MTSQRQSKLFKHLDDSRSSCLLQTLFPPLFLFFYLARPFFCIVISRSMAFAFSLFFLRFLLIFFLFTGLRRALKLVFIDVQYRASKQNTEPIQWERGGGLGCCIFLFQLIKENTPRPTISSYSRSSASKIWTKSLKKH